MITKDGSVNLRTNNRVANGPAWQRISGLLAAVVVTSFSTGLCLLIDRRLDDANLVMIYLLGVALVASRFGLYESAFASVLAVVSFDFFFVEPRYTFAAANTQSLITFGVMLAVALLISSLSIKLRAASK